MPIVWARRCGATAVFAWIACTLGMIPFSAVQGAEPLNNLDMVRAVTREAIGKLVANFPVPGRRVEVKVEPFHETGWLVQDIACEALRARGYEVVEGSPLLKPAASSRPDTTKPDTTKVAPPESGSTAPGSTAGAKPDTTQAGMPDSTKAAPADSMKAAAAAADSMKAAQAAALERMRAAAADSIRLATAASLDRARGQAVDAHLEIRVVELGLTYPRVHRTRFFFGGGNVERFAAAKLLGKVRYAEDPAVRWSGEGEAKAMDRVSGSTLARVEGLSYPFTAPTLPKGNAGRIIEPIIVSAIVVGLVFLFVSNRS